MTRDDDEKNLFRNAVAGIRPLRHDQKEHHAVRRAGPSPTRQTAEHEPPMGEEQTIGDFIRYLRPGSDQRLLKKLQQGKLPPQTTLDLHGCTRAEARLMLDSFLNDCREDGLHSLLIIHGKGWRSEDFKPVLKNALNHWLPQFPFVVAFCSARTHHGGNGALYVLLR